MRELLQHGVCDNPEKIAEFAQAVPPKIRNIFYYYYYRVRKQTIPSSESLNQLKPLARDDVRLDLCRRHLLLDAGRRSEAMDELKLDSSDPFLRVLFYDLWLAYWDQSPWTEKTLSYYEGFLDVLSDVTSPILTRAQVKENENYMVARLASNLAKKQLTQYATRLLEARSKNLNHTSFTLLAALYISSNQYDKALTVMEKQLNESPPDQRQDVLRLIMDYSILTNDYTTAARFLNQARQDPKTASIIEEYQPLLTSSPQNVNAGSHRLNVPGHFLLDDTSWQDWVGLGPCAFGSAFSVLKFWKKDVDYAGVKADLTKLYTQTEDPFAALGQYLANYGLDLIYMAPGRTAVVNLLSKGVPVILLNTVSIDGMTFNHASVIYAYDDRLGKVFCRNGSDAFPDASLKYTQLAQATALAAVMPRTSAAELVTGPLKNLVIPSLYEFVTTETMSQMETIDPSLKWWACRHNGTAMMKRKDAPECVKWYEQCAALKQPSDAPFYEDLVLACILDNKLVKALQYIDLGLQKAPHSLSLLRYQLELRRDNAARNKTLDASLGRELIALTDRMEAVNPDYPLTYLLRGDLYMRALNQPQPALSAYLLFLEKYQTLNEPWQQKFAANRAQAQTAAKLCRDCCNLRHP